MKNKSKLLTLLVLTQLVSIYCAEDVARKDRDDKYMHRFHVNPRPNVEYESAEFWKKSAQDTLKGKITNEDKIVGEAKNLILYLGDGWGISTVTAARILKGQQVDEDVQFGEEAKLHIEDFPFFGLSKTFCSNYQTAESACTSTAYLGGTKANAATIGLTPAVKRYDCAAQQDQVNHVSSILAWAQAAGKSTGIITTTRITHASPAGAYAHTSNREWESDTDVALSLQNPDICDDIAEQLILSEPGKNINVILGGGTDKFIPRSEGGSRSDGKNLINHWFQEKIEAGLKAQVLLNGTELSHINASNTDYLLGLFASSHLEFFHDQAANHQPTLTDMVEKAVEILGKNPNGFFLFVEGGRIDHGHHNNTALRALWEAVEFDRAIKKGDDMTSDKDTLIVATADHSHPFMLAGYAARGNPIAEYSDNLADDNMKTGTLNYANGPGWKPFTGGQRHDIGQDDVTHINYRQVPLIPLVVDTHGSEDVGIFAKGPFAHYLTGVNHQNYIPHVMAYAGCIGDGLKYCDK